MPFDEMLSWLLFYTSIFRTAKAPTVDIIDPSGIVRSQAIENADGTLRLTLNGAENTRTFAGRFIAEAFGSAVQHLAFASRDIFATAAALTANGFETLAISPNYYDDVEARFGLDPDFADRLQAAEHPLRPRRARRVLPALQPELRRGLLLRDRRAPRRLPRLRRPERPVPHRRPEAPPAPEGAAAGVKPADKSLRIDEIQKFIPSISMP